MNLTLTVDRIEEDKAVLLTDDNKEIIWPTKKLPENIHEGQVLYINISDVADRKEGTNRKLAKDILNEILDVDENRSHV